MGRVDEEAGLPSTTQSTGSCLALGILPCLLFSFCCLVSLPCSCLCFFPYISDFLSPYLSLDPLYLFPRAFPNLLPTLSFSVSWCPSVAVPVSSVFCYSCLCFCRLSTLSDPSVSTSIPLDPPALPQWRNATLPSLTSSMSRTPRYTIFRRRLKR